MMNKCADCPDRYDCDREECKMIGGNMNTYKLIGTKPGETPEAAIIRCANNLVKAVLAAGYSIHSTSGCSGCDVTFFNHRPAEISVYNTLSHWNVEGKTPLKITFAPEEPENDLTQDDAKEEL